MSNRVEPFIQATHDARTDFTYDGNGNVLTFKCRSGGLTGKVVGTVTYTYDVNGNLTSQKFDKVD